MTIGRESEAIGSSNYRWRRASVLGYAAARRMAAKGARMSVEVMAHVWKRKREFRGSTLIVALALADFAADDGTHIFPSMETLAFKARLKDTRSARRLVSKLEACGFLIREESGVGRGNRAHWRIDLSIARKGTESSAFGSAEKGSEMHGFGSGKPDHRNEKTGPTVHRKPDKTGQFRARLYCTPACSPRESSACSRSR